MTVVHFWFYTRNNFKSYLKIAAELENISVSFCEPEKWLDIVISFQVPNTIARYPFYIHLFSDKDIWVDVTCNKVHIFFKSLTIYYKRYAVFPLLSALPFYFFFLCIQKDQCLENVI